MSDPSLLPVPPEAPRPSPARRWILHGGLFLATLVVTTFFGGWHHASFLVDFGQPPPPLSYDDLAFWLGGLWFSVPVLAILGTHEAGHYFACRHHGVEASLPYFLPAPLPLSGTFGAFIRIRDVIPHKQALFDIGASGPFAGFAVAVPMLVAGLAWSRLAAMPRDLDVLVLGEPVIYQATQYLLWGPLPVGQVLHVHPMAQAAWFGLLATALNLFPLAQLDGGHVAYAVFGRRATWITIGTSAVIVALTTVSLSWIAWAGLSLLVLLTAGPGHPPTADDALPLGRRRQLAAVAAAIVFLLCFTAAPVEPQAADGAPDTLSTSR